MLQAVAAHGSVAAAAEAPHVSPPAVSRQLLALERETGASLVDRSGRQVRLTAAASPAVQPVITDPSLPTRHYRPVITDPSSPTRHYRPVITKRYGPAAVAGLRLGDLDIVLTE